MFHHLSFSKRSREIINGIWENAKRQPMAAKYNVIMDESSYFSAGAIAIRFESSHGLSNMFLFFPSPEGEICSCAIYGLQSQLINYKNVIERSMSLFGLPVESVEWDEGYEKFLDVTFK